MYTLVFEDDSKFIGGNADNSKWNEIPDKSIKSLTYKLAGKTIYLENFKAYNHIVERVNILGKINYISKVILMAKENEQVLCFVFNYKKNNLYLEKRLFGHEYNNTFTSGWKKSSASNLSSKYQIS